MAIDILPQNIVLEQVDPRSLYPHPRNTAIYGDESIEELKQQIVKSGWIKPLVVTQNNVVISGHRRWRVGNELNLVSVPVERRSFANETDELEALLLENTYREKTPEQKYHEGETWKEIESERAKERQLAALKQNRVETIPNDTVVAREFVKEDFIKKEVNTTKSEPADYSSVRVQGPIRSFEEKEKSSLRARDIVATRVGLGSGSTYDRVGKAVDAAKELEINGKVEAAKVLRTVLNTQSIKAASEVAMMPEPQKLAVLETLATGKAKDVKEAKTVVKREEQAEQAKTVILPSNMKVLHGDFRILVNQFADSSVDMIFTDPPYHQEHLQLWSDLSQFAFRVLKPGGILLAYSGQIFLPDVLNRLSQHLDYCWLLGVQHTGGHIQIWKHTLWNDWKPIVMFSKGKPAEHEWFMDLYRGDKGDKSSHEWSQGESEASYFIEKLTKHGSLVVDPMCGSGTILRAAHKLKRWTVGIEVDEQRYTIAYSGMKGLMEVAR